MTVVIRLQVHKKLLENLMIMKLSLIEVYLFTLNTLQATHTKPMNHVV